MRFVAAPTIVIDKSVGGSDKTKTTVSIHFSIALNCTNTVILPQRHICFGHDGKITFHHFYLLRPSLKLCKSLSKTPICNKRKKVIACPRLCVKNTSQQWSWDPLEAYCFCSGDNSRRACHTNSKLVLVFGSPEVHYFWTTWVKCQEPD